MLVAIFTLNFCLAHSSQAEIKVKVDSFTGKTTVNTKPTPFTERPSFNLLGRYRDETDKPNAVLSILLYSSSPTWQYLHCYSTFWLADNKPINLPQPTHKGFVGTGFVMEHLAITPVPLSALQQMATAQKVEFKVCNDEFTLTTEEMKDLKRFVEIFTSPSPPTPSP